MSADNNPSFIGINYRLRPAKNVQRKLICDTLQAVDRLMKLRDCKYVGFGSIYFADYYLFHRFFGLRDMISIEAELTAESRVQFNRPFGCIKIEMGTSAQKLPEIEWNEKPCLVWLDYDYALNASALADVATVARSVRPYSVIIVSVDAREQKITEYDDQNEIGEEEPPGWDELSILDRLEQKFGAGRIPQDYRHSDLTTERLQDLCRYMLGTEIQSAARGTRATGYSSGAHYEQFFNFRYADKAQMMTVGGMILPNDNFEDLERTGVFNLDYVKRGSDSYNIEIPNLTFREVRALDQYMPTANPAELNVPVPPELKTSYAKIYRHYPAFTEAEV